MVSLRILIAEDDKLSATLLKVLLEAEGHVVCGVSSSGASAVEAARTLQPDAVLMDIFLSDDISGVDAARTIVKELAIPTLFITGASDKAVLEQVVESGALGLIKKPVSADELRVNLSILRHHQAMRQRLWEQAARYKGIFNDAPVGMYVADMSGVIVECNAALAHMLGYDSPAQLQESVLYADRLYEAVEHRSMMLRCMRPAPDSPRPLPARLHQRGGGVLEVMEYVDCMPDDQGRDVNCCSVLVPRCSSGGGGAAELDVLRSTIDAIPDMVVVMAKDRTVLAANKAFFKHVGDEGGGVDLAHFPFAGDAAPCRGECPFARFLADGKEHSGWVRFVSDGPEFYNSVTPLRLADGTVQGCVQVFRLMPSRK